MLWYQQISVLYHELTSDLHLCDKSSVSKKYYKKVIEIISLIFLHKLQAFVFATLLWCTALDTFPVLVPSQNTKGHSHSEWVKKANSITKML